MNTARHVPVGAADEPTLDPALARVVEALQQSSTWDLDAMPMQDALALVRRPVDTEPPRNSQDIVIPGGSGNDLRVRLYFPDGDRTGAPVLMHLHGGGFVTGTVEMDDARCSSLAAQAGCIVASVDYRLAPEHPFPEPIEDAFAAWRWLTTRASDFGGDPRRAAISGSSAGGHLAIGVCLLARRRGVQMPLLQVLTYPVVDPALASASYHRFADGPFLTRARMAWFWKSYAATGDVDGELWSPLSASLAGLPPAHVITAEYDVLRDEAEAYADALHDAGVAATVRRHGGMIHGFLAMVPDHPESAAALREKAAVLRKAFAAPPDERDDASDAA